MSGRRINDYGGLPHTSDMSMKSKNYVKNYKSAEGAGHLGTEYPDTTEEIHRDQMKADSVTKAHKTKPGFRH